MNMKLFDNETSGAEFSNCGKYRYSLWRIWDFSKPKAMCIGLNPSKANADKNDNTINLLIHMLRLLDYGGFYMTNLFAFISSNPDDLLTCDDPMGENEWKLREIHAKCDVVITCWGDFKQAEKRRQEVMAQYPNTLCFGINKNGTPFHPRAMNYKGLINSPMLSKYSCP